MFILLFLRYLNVPTYYKQISYENDAPVSYFLGKQRRQTGPIVEINEKVQLNSV